jgi:hypothetical protein
MPAVRIEFTVPQDTFDAIEAVRGDVPRAAWIKRLIDEALSEAQMPHAVPVEST